MDTRTDFFKTFMQSTCQKRVTICEIYDKDNNLLSRESNRCNPTGGTCHRLDTSNTKKDYPTESHCNWEHAEARAVKSLPKGSEPYMAILYGHDFYCDDCEKKLKDSGVQVLRIENLKQR